MTFLLQIPRSWDYRRVSTCLLLLSLTYCSESVSLWTATILNSNFLPLATELLQWMPGDQSSSVLSIWNKNDLRRQKMYIVPEERDLLEEFEVY